MSTSAEYAVIRIDDETYRLDRVVEPRRILAFIKRVSDRANNPVGWRLKPSVVMQGSKSRIWPNPAEAIASTQLLSKKEALTKINAWPPS